MIIFTPKELGQLDTLEYYNYNFPSATTRVKPVKISLPNYNTFYDYSITGLKINR